MPETIPCQATYFVEGVTTIGDECSQVGWRCYHSKCPAFLSYNLNYFYKQGGEKHMKKYSDTIILDIIHRLEQQQRNIDIAKECNVSLSLVEQINGCRVHTNLHNYTYNIRNENKKPTEFRKSVLNEYIENDDYYILHIINTRNVEAFGKIDKDDYERIKQHKWTLSIHENDIRIVANDASLHRIGLHQFIVNNYDNNMVIDHINRDPLDNRKNNLRITTRAINSTNAKARKNNNCEIRGVYKRDERPGIAKASWVCEWTDENHKRHSKSFSIAKYGEDEAFRLAKSLREEKMKEMKI